MNPGRRITINLKSGAEESFWRDLCNRINEQQVIPVISNALRNELVFDPTFEGDLGNSPNPGKQGYEFTIEERVAAIWAEALEYPMTGQHQIPRVAQYNRVMSDDAAEAKRNYLQFLKLALLAQEEARIGPEKYGEMESATDRWTFTEMANELGLPRYKSPDDDPLNLLASLPLSTYVTTSYYTFLEKALAKRDKTPQVQVCFWSGVPMNVADHHRPNPNPVPTPDCPLVYHLLGLEDYPSTMVLSEDDYLDFVIAIAKDNSLIPPWLGDAVTDSSLILLGYRLSEWDFRVLFRGLIKAKHNRLRERNRSLIIQLDPRNWGEIDEDRQKRIREYLKEYFKPDYFGVQWDDSGHFIRELWNKWDKWIK